MARYLYSELSGLIQARRNSAQNIAKRPEASNSQYWCDKHRDTIDSLVKQHMPHGSGFDAGTIIDLDASHADKLVFHTSFHHMNDGGFYDGWTEHTITVTPALHGDFHLRISGRNRNDIKEMVYQDFDYLLRTDVTYDLYCEHFPELCITHKWEELDGSPSQSSQAFYVGEKRFHSGDKFDDGCYHGSSLERARAYAGEEMYKRFMTRK